MTAQIQTIGIAGAGAWGTALANAAAIAGNDVVLWMRSPEQAAALAATRSNARFLPDVSLHERIRATADHEGARRHRRRASRHARADDAGDDVRPVRHPALRNAAGALRQGHRARKRRLSLRRGGRGAPRLGHRRALRAELRRRRGARPADRRDARLPRRGAGAKSLRRRCPARRCASITARTCAGSRSGGLPRTCSPSPAARWPGKVSARARRRRSSPAASRSSCASPAPMAATRRP